MINLTADDCLPCEERERRREALVGIRRGAIAIQRGVETLLALLEPECREPREDDGMLILDTDHSP